MRKAHLISALIFVLFSIVALYLSNELPGSRRGVPGPAVWPVIISCAILISGCILFFKTLRKSESEPLEILNSDNIRVYITMGTLCWLFSSYECDWFCSDVVSFDVRIIYLV